MSPRSRRHAGGETAAALIWAILLMLVMGGLVAGFVMMAQRSSERSSDASRRVANSATVQTSVTRVLYGFQNNLGSEIDFYTLSQGDLTNIVRSVGGTAKALAVTDLPRLPVEYRRTYGVWEHHVDRDGDDHQLVQVTLPDGRPLMVPNAVVEESIAPDARACVAAELPRKACQAGSVRAYWQVVRVVMPDITGRDAPNVVLTIRSWLGDRAAGAWSRASYARVELRPGRFADFQLIADGNARFGPGAVIDGPVHSNGFADGSFSTVHEPDRNVGQSWVWLDRGVACKGKASITITRGRIDGPGVARTCNAQGSNGQTISFLRALDSVDVIRREALRSRPGTMYFQAPPSRRGDENAQRPYDTAWSVTLEGSRMRVRYPDGAAYPRAIDLHRVNAFVFDEDVKVRGHVGADRRVTIAARRSGPASASVFIDGNVRKGDAKSTAIGLIAHGDVVIWQTEARPCAVSTVQAALVAATGGVTIPTNYTTDEIQDGAPRCSQPIELDGSIAGHRPPTLVWTWPALRPGSPPVMAGFANGRTYEWDDALRRNPPPYFPLTGTWQPFSVREANADCLFDPGSLRDPACR